MFVYNTRTEINQGTTFIEKDIMLFDYTYTGDIVFQVDAVLKNSGFGFVIKEDDGDDIQTTDNIVLITIASDKSYRIILQNGGEQVTSVDRYVDNGAGLYNPEGETWLFKKHEDLLSVYRAWRGDDKEIHEACLLTYRMQNDMNSYRVGIYSNQGNTVRFAAIRTEAPSNWISNVFNAGGGRIKWIRNGFIIDEAQYEIEVEAEDILMPAGTYWFDYETDNPDMRAFVYESHRHRTDARRERDEILNTMFDEEKNLLKEGNCFELKAETTVNIKFRGKWGTVKNICIKDNKLDDFVETSYGNTLRPRSWIRFDLEKIKEIEIKAKILSVAENDAGERRNYSIFRRGNLSMWLVSPIRLDETFTYRFSTETNMLTINGTNQILIAGSDPYLYAFDNVTAVISKFIVTLQDGKTIDVLLQRTAKYVVNNSIDSPILVFNEDDEPLDLSSAYRQVAIIRPRLELFNAMNPIRLEKDPTLTNLDVHVYGIPYTRLIQNNEVRITVHKEAATIEEMADYYEEIPYTPDPAALIKRSVKIPYDTRKNYQYIAVSYQAIDGFRYWFTNWEREIYDLTESSKVYLTHTPLNPDYDFVVYGIKDASLFNKDLLYYTVDEDIDTSIDLAAYDYDNISAIEEPQSYRINDLGKVALDKEILKKYKYLIIDYLKAESFVINERADVYEADIASVNTKTILKYDSEDGETTHPYRLLSSINKMFMDDKLEEERSYILQENDFVVLETES